MHKGILMSLEAVLAIIMILIVFITYYGTKEQLPEFETINWQLKTMSALRALDNTNDLRSYVVENNSIGLNNKLNPLLPPEVNHQVFICETQCGKTNVTSEKIVSVSYLVAGDINNFKPRQVFVFLW